MLYTFFAMIAVRNLTVYMEAIRTFKYLCMNIYVYIKVKCELLQLIVVYFFVYDRIFISVKNNNWVNHHKVLAALAHRKHLRAWIVVSHQCLYTQRRVLRYIADSSTTITLSYAAGKHVDLSRLPAGKER